MTLIPRVDNACMTNGSSHVAKGKPPQVALFSSALAFSLVLAQPPAHSVSHYRLAPSLVDSSSAATKSSAEGLDILEELYFWENYAGVRRLLLTYPETHGLLVHAASLMNGYFGAGSHLSLRVVPELDGAGPPMLRADIYTAQSPIEALDNLDRFDEDWWLDAMPLVNGTLSFGLRYL
jgi:hypothetical protein